jgi:hypothetical protein
MIGAICTAAKGWVHEEQEDGDDDNVQYDLT